MWSHPGLRLCEPTTKAAVVLTALFVLHGDSFAAELVVQSASGRPGEAVEIPVLLNPQEENVAAVVFEIDYDLSRLQFDPVSSGTVAVGTSDSSRFAIETFDLSSSGGRIGVAVYDPEAPVTPIPAGVVATLRFYVRQGATGFAPITVGGRAPDAADVNGKTVAVSLDTGSAGVTISGGRSRPARRH